MKKIFVSLAVILFMGAGCTVNQKSMEQSNKQVSNAGPEVCVNMSLKECFESSAGKKITVQGRVSNVMQAHITAPPTGYEVVSYIDTQKKGQIVVYSKEALALGYENWVELTGTVIEVKSGGEGTKAGEEGLTEYQLLVDEWKALNPGAPNLSY